VGKESYFETEVDDAKARFVKHGTADFTDACELKVEAGTTLECGGDWGHGGRTYVRMMNVASVGWLLRVRDWDGREYVFEPVEVEILLGGDAEYHVFVKALEFALNILKR